MKYLNYNNCIFSLLLFILASPAWAQYPSEDGQFEVDAMEICTGATITVTSSCTSCDYDFNEDGSTLEGMSYQYDQPGTYVIQSFITSGVSDQIKVTVHPDTVPQFNIYRCGSNTIELEINDNNYDSYLIDYGDGSLPVPVSGSDNQELKTYTSSGTYTISVQGLYDSGPLDNNGNCTPNEKQVEVLGTIPIAEITEIYPLNNQPDKLVIKYTAPEDALYRLQLAVNNSSNWIPANEILSTADSIIINVASLNDNFYCYRISTLNACQPGNPAIAFSNELCTQKLNVNFTNNEENILNWTTHDTSGTDISIEIEEAGSILSTPNFPISRRSYTDTEVQCNLEYCYTIITNYPGGAVVRSLKKCGLAKFVTTPPAISDMSSQVEDDQITLKWSEAPDPYVAEFYNLYLAVNSNNSELKAGELTATEFIDTDLSPSSSSYCYNVNYEDRCENISQLSRDFCALRLTGTALQQTVRLQWNNYSGYSDGISEFIIEKFNANGNLLETFTSVSNQFTDSLKIDDPQEIHYRVTAVPSDGAFENSVSNIFVARRSARVAAPNAFIPGSGGENSTFNIVGPFISELDLQIFNRWGEMVYRTTDPAKGWPGTDQDGNPLPQGTYIYSAKIISENGEMRKASGSVLLLRK